MAAAEQLRKRIEAQQAEAREITGSFVDESVTTAREYAAAANAAMLGGIKTAFALQDQGLAASREVLDASIEATKKLVEAWAGTLRAGQTAATKAATTGAKLIEDTLATK